MRADDNYSDMLSIIFIIGFSKHIGDGCDVEALHYLTKPVDKKKLFQILDRYACRHKSDNRIILPSRNEALYNRSVLYIELLKLYLY